MMETHYDLIVKTGQAALDSTVGFEHMKNMIEEGDKKVALRIAKALIGDLEEIVSGIEENM
jgi:hypothetical protein